MPSSYTGSRQPSDSVAQFYVLDLSDKLHNCTVRRETWDIESITSVSILAADGADSCEKLNCDVWLFRYILNDCLSERCSRTNFLRSAEDTRKNGGRQMLLRLHETSKEPIDYDWCNLNVHTVYTHVELDHLTSWLSTLGGGYSALGDSMNKCADIAGRISMYQFRLALQFGAPPLVARSKLYMAIALIQKHRLRIAKYLTRSVYHRELAERDVDERLLNMCHGIWLKLQWAYSQRGVQAA